MTMFLETNLESCEQEMQKQAAGNPEGTEMGDVEKSED